MTSGAPWALGPAVRGTFHRAVDPRFRDSVLAGSRLPGRYSRADEPTLYLSSSVDGVEAAMIAHRDARAPEPAIVAVDVEATRVVDLRDPLALAQLGIDLADATAPWQEVVAAGGVPSSWSVRDRLVEAGAQGLIDPSRKRPGLWHLVLFRWNEPGAPTVRLLTQDGWSSRSAGSGGALRKSNQTRSPDRDAPLVRHEQYRNCPGGAGDRPCDGAGT